MDVLTHLQRTFESTSLQEARTKCQESMNTLSFQTRLYKRKLLRKKSSTLGSLIDIHNDLEPIEPDYEGPSLSLDSPITYSFVRSLKVHFAQEKLLHRNYVYLLLMRVEEYYRKVPVVVDIKLPKDAKIHIIGDIHGQFYDLLKIFKARGSPSSKIYYLFNGDMVDKGSKSLECILLLFAMKLCYPNYIYLNRGNHESYYLNSTDGFQKELSTKYPTESFMVDLFSEVFKWLPLVHLISNRIMVVHGGLPSKEDVTVTDIRKIKRPVEPHSHKLTGDLLWSDPVLEEGISKSSRGIGVFFGPDVTKKFLDRNDLMCVVRSHAEIQEGCGQSHPKCYTVFSAPNKAKGIQGGILTVDGNHLAKNGSVFPESTEGEIEAFKTGLMESDDDDDEEGNSDNKDNNDALCQMINNLNAKKAQQA